MCPKFLIKYTNLKNLDKNNHAKWSNYNNEYKEINSFNLALGKKYQLLMLTFEAEWYPYLEKKSIFFYELSSGQYARG